MSSIVTIPLQSCCRISILNGYILKNIFYLCVCLYVCDMWEREIHSKLHYSLIYKCHNVDTMSKWLAIVGHWIMLVCKINQCDCFSTPSFSPYFICNALILSQSVVRKNCWKNGMIVKFNDTTGIYQHYWFISLFLKGNEYLMSFVALVASFSLGRVIQLLLHRTTVLYLFLTKDTCICKNVFVIHTYCHQIWSQFSFTLTFYKNVYQYIMFLWQGGNI